MKREILEKQIRNLRNRRLGRAKKAEAIVTKNSEGAVKVSSSHVQALISKLPKTTIVNQKPISVNKNQSSGCDCSRGRK